MVSSDGERAYERRQAGRVAVLACLEHGPLRPLALELAAGVAPDELALVLADLTTSGLVAFERPDGPLGASGLWRRTR